MSASRITMVALADSLGISLAELRRLMRDEGLGGAPISAAKARQVRQVIQHRRSMLTWTDVAREVGISVPQVRRLLREHAALKVAGYAGFHPRIVRSVKRWHRAEQSCMTLGEAASRLGLTVARLRALMKRLQIGLSRGQRRLTPAAFGLLVQRVPPSGLSVAAAARHLGMGESTLRKWLRRHRLKRPSGWKTLTPALLEQLRAAETDRRQRMTRRGYTAAEAASLLGVSETTLRARMRARGLWKPRAWRTFSPELLEALGEDARAGG